MLNRPDQRIGARILDVEETAGRDRWLLSYADFITLLLALFVVLYASARVDESRDASLFEGLQAAFFFDQSSPSPVPTRGPAPGAEAANAEALAPVPVLMQLEEDLVDAVERTPREPGEEPGISLHQTERGLVIRLASTEFFPAGGAEIPPERRAALGAMAPALASTTSSLQFEGHTDSQPVGPGPYPSNWELSAARAAGVARVLVEAGQAPESVEVQSFGEYRPVADNATAEGRAQNRRVEIFFSRDHIRDIALELQDAGVPPEDEAEPLEGMPGVP